MIAARDLCQICCGDVPARRTWNLGARARLSVLTAMGALGFLFAVSVGAQETLFVDWPASAALQVSPAVTIWVNGRLIGVGVVTSDDSVYMRVSDLARAVEGDSAAQPAHLKLADNDLYAIAEGSCTGCPVRVARAVLISSSVRSLNGEPHIPVADLIRAFEGRLDANRGAGAYRIYAGACNWCILEPASVSSARSGR